MSVLSIQNIFSNFDFYQAHYTSLIECPNFYYQVVENSQIYFGKISTQTLYLGDLLQLWFNAEWTDGVIFAEGKAFGLATQNNSFDQQLYFFSIHSNPTAKMPIALAWSRQEQKVVQLNLEQSFCYYLSFIRLKRPKHAA